MDCRLCQRKDKLKMKQEWKVETNFAAGIKQYAVYRIRAIGETDHSGNREYATGYLKDRKQAENIAKALNSEEE